jgi:hypothetical protein
MPPNALIHRRYITALITVPDIRNDICQNSMESGKFRVEVQSGWRAAFNLYEQLAGMQVDRLLSYFVITLFCLRLKIDAASSQRPVSSGQDIFIYQR